MESVFQLTQLLAAGPASPEGEAHHIGWGASIIAVGTVIVALLAILASARAGTRERVFKNQWTQRAEQLYLFLENFAIGIIGPHGRKYITLLATYWLFIFVANIMGLFVDYTPTADLSLNLGLSISAILYVQWEGIRSNGFFGHIRHFAGPKLGGMLLLVSAMIFIIEVISETMKMLSLSLRLYGNIHGGHEVVHNLDHLGHLDFFGIGLNIPVGGLLLPIKLLTCVVQALVFTLLLSVYLGLVTHHEDESHERPEDQGHGVARLSEPEAAH
jgi:F-type H+-transporting ATPase subunit a